MNVFIDSDGKFNSRAYIEIEGVEHDLKDCILMTEQELLLIVKGKIPSRLQAIVDRLNGGKYMSNYSKLDQLETRLDQLGDLVFINKSRLSTLEEKVSNGVQWCDKPHIETRLAKLEQWSTDLKQHFHPPLGTRPKNHCTHVSYFSPSLE